MEKLQKLDIVKELAGNKTVLLLMPSLEYNDVIVKIAEELSGKSVCYVTLNKTYDSLKELFNKKKVDMSNIVFVDAISNCISKCVCIVPIEYDPSVESISPTESARGLANV